MIRFEQVGKRYPNGHVGLHELSFHVKRGEFLFVTGHSGAGKSTLLRLLLAMERPSSGKLLLAGQDLSRISNAQIPFLRRQIGVVFQNHQLLFDRTVFDNAALPLQILGLNKREIGQRVMTALERVSLKDKALQYPSDLSTGQQQRVGIARAVVHRPALLLADEPTGALDSAASDRPSEKSSRSINWSNASSFHGTTSSSSGSSPGNRSGYRSRATTSQDWWLM